LDDDVDLSTTGCEAGRADACETDEPSDDDDDDETGTKWRTCAEDEDEDEDDANDEGGVLEQRSEASVDGEVDGWGAADDDDEDDDDERGGRGGGGNIRVDGVGGSETVEEEEVEGR
jgi:hypothetical protein